ncbi:MAG: TraM recognition domain-containing protein [Nitrospirae bacterium]|nr:TraM recognition domain-containing protein [Nitrospirota bacterium]
MFRWFGRGEDRRRPTTGGRRLGGFPRVFQTGRSVESGKPVWIWNDGVEHVIIVGISGAGKTTFLKYLANCIISGGGGYLHVTGKPTDEVLKTLHWMAVHAGRGDQFYLLDINRIGRDGPAVPRWQTTPGSDGHSNRRPWSGAEGTVPGGPWMDREGADREAAGVYGRALRTHRWDPLFGLTAPEQVQVVLSVLDPEYFRGDKIYYSEMATSFLHPLMQALRSTGVRYTLKDVRAFFAYPELAVRYLRSGTYRRSQGIPEEVKLLEDELLRYQMSKSNTDKLAMMLSQMDANLRFFTSPPYDEVFCPAVPDFEMMDCIRGNAVVAVCLAPMGREDIARRFGRLFVANLKASIGRILMNLSYQKPDPIFTVALDEFGAFASPQMAVLFEQCREARVRLIPALQTIETLEDPSLGLNPSFRKRVFENCAVKMFFTLGADSADIAQGYFGQTRKTYRSVSRSDQRGLSMAAHGLSHLGRSLGKGWQEGYQEREAWTVPAREFIGLRKWEAIVDEGDSVPRRADLMRLFDCPEGHEMRLLSHQGHFVGRLPQKEGRPVGPGSVSMLNMWESCVKQVRLQC